MLATIREAFTLHIELLIECGDTVPEPAMSVDDAIAHHSEGLTESDKGSLAEYRDAAPTFSTMFRLVEIEVPALPLETV